MKKTRHRSFTIRTKKLYPENHVGSINYSIKNSTLVAIVTYLLGDEIVSILTVCEEI